MANELTHNYLINVNVYAIRFNLDENPFLTDGSSSEAWSTVGDYDVIMAETSVNASMHYVADFDASGNIAAGSYSVTIYERAGGAPANADKAIAQGIIYWDGTKEVDPMTMTEQLDILEENTTAGDTSGGGIPTGAIQPEDSILNVYDFTE